MECAGKTALLKGYPPYDMKKVSIDTNSWQRFSSGKTMWRTILRNGSISSEDHWMAKQKATRDRRRQRRALNDQTD